MRSIDAFARLKELRLPALRTSDAMAILGVNKAAASSVLARLQRAGQLVRVKRGLWVFPGQADPLALAGHLAHPFPAYVSLQSALFHHAMISQVPEVVYVVSPARTRVYRTPLGTFSLHHVSPSFFFGFGVLPSGGKMATPEKALLDVFYLSPARSNLFRALPEITLPARFSVRAAEKMIRLAGRSRRITLLERKFFDFMSRHAKTEDR